MANGFCCVSQHHWRPYKFIIYLEYDDIDKVMLGDGLGSVVSHIGSPKITLKKFHFKLYTLCPQFVQKSNFCSLLYFQKQCFYWILPFLFSCEGQDVGGDPSKRCMWKWNLHFSGITGGFTFQNGCLCAWKNFSWWMAQMSWTPVLQNCPQCSQFLSYAYVK